MLFCNSNRLKGDIVEALQCVKCSIQRDLLFSEPSPSSAVEASDCEEGNEGGDIECEEESEVEEVAWDELLIEDDGDDEALSCSD
jgi:hypothetical protein